MPCRSRPAGAIFSGRWTDWHKEPSAALIAVIGFADHCLGGDGQEAQTVTGMSALMILPDHFLRRIPGRTALKRQPNFAGPLLLPRNSPRLLDAPGRYLARRAKEIPQFSLAISFTQGRFERYATFLFPWRHRLSALRQQPRRSGSG
jgi:hypothetical protein